MNWPAYIAIAVIHQPAELLAQRDHDVRHARGDQAGVVGLDLVVDCPGAVVELGMARVGRSDAVTEILAPRIVGHPQRIAAVGEVDPRLPLRHVQPVLLQRAEERHLHVQVVLAEGVIDERVAERRHLVCGHDLPVASLGGRAPRYADDLPDPAGLHLVAVLPDRQTAELLAADRRQQPG